MKINGFSAFLSAYLSILSNVLKGLDKSVFSCYNKEAVNKKEFTHYERKAFAMSKNLRNTLLLDLYGMLLTDKQRETLEMYYENDLSLGEISAETGITRQGVMNCIKNAEARLTELEGQLGLVKRLSEMRDFLRELEEEISSSGISDTEKLNKINSIIEDIKERL